MNLFELNHLFDDTQVHATIQLFSLLSHNNIRQASVIPSLTIVVLNTEMTNNQTFQFI